MSTTLHPAIAATIRDALEYAIVESARDDRIGHADLTKYGLTAAEAIEALYQVRHVDIDHDFSASGELEAWGSTDDGLDWRIDIRITEADEDRAAELPGSPMQVYAGWVWYIEGREPFKALTREALIRDVLSVVDRFGVEGAFGADADGLDQESQS